jgi:putative hydrolase of the HAD superfamily
MTNTNSVRTVCFDLGGVLIRICRTWEEGCARAGVPVRDPQARASTTLARHQLIVDYQTGRISGDEFAQRVSAALNHLYSSEEIMIVHHAWMHGEYPGVFDVIQDLNRAGAITAALSNTNHEHWLALPAFPAFMSLRHRYASHELGLHKPDPAIFTEVERRLASEGVDTTAILYFDDLSENVAAASNAGWIAVQIDHAGDTAEQIRAAAAVHGVLTPGPTRPVHSS